MARELGESVKRMREMCLFSLLVLVSSSSVQIMRARRDTLAREKKKVR